MGLSPSSSVLRAQYALNALLFLLLWVPIAHAFSPKVLRREQESWSPARETGATDNANRIGWSPKPTDAPGARYGEMELFKRYTMGTNTCGFVSGYSSAPITCVKFGAYCTNDGVADMDCCDSGVAYNDCTSSMYSSCVDYSASALGGCSSKGPRTICCPSASPSCYTFLFSTTTAPGKVFSVLQCQESGGVATLLAEPPVLAASESSLLAKSSSSTLVSPTTTTITTTTTSSASNSSSDGGSSTPIGAIVGGAVGGLAVIGIVVVMIVYILKHKKGDKKKPIPQSAQPTTYPPEPKYPYGTPGYPAEAPANESSYFGQDPYAHSTTTSPSQTVTSPGTTTLGGSSYGTYGVVSPGSVRTPDSHPLASELPVTEAPGSHRNRAELAQ